MNLAEQIILEVTFDWVCQKCGLRLLSVDDEEWPFCCGHTMKLQPMRRLKLKESPNE